MFRHILAATDGSDLADRGIISALRLAKAIGAEVTVVTVTDVYPTGPYSPIPWPADIERYEAAAAVFADQILAKVQAAAQKLDVGCTTRHVRDRIAAEGIVAACRDNACDLIVMSSHGRSGFSRLILGSQAVKVLAVSSVPVLICR